MSESRPKREPWFGRTDGGIGIAPRTWQGRFSTALYVFLVIVAVLVYSDFALLVFVVLFYTAAFVGVVIVTSDLLDQRDDHDQPER